MSDYAKQNIFAGDEIDTPINIYNNLPDAATLLWAKTDQKTHTSRWLSLPTHMYDAYLASLWVFDNCLEQQVINCLCEGTGESVSRLRKCVAFLCMIHDIGKATPGFQSKASVNSAELATLGYRLSKQRHGYNHASSGAGLLLNMLLARNYDFSFSCSLTSVVAAHHGMPMEHDPNGRSTMSKSDGYGRAWMDLRWALLDWCVATTGVTDLLTRTEPFPRRALVLLSGIVMLVDWFVSDEERYPLDGNVSIARLEQRLAAAQGTVVWERQNALSTTVPSANDLLHISAPDLSSSASPNSMQHLVYKMAYQMPINGIMVIEADMGLGKTEASEMAADIIARRSGITGVAYALPTMATTDAMFGRLQPLFEYWASNMGDSTVRLAHSRYRMSTTWNSIWESQGRLVIEPWYNRSKLALLSDFAVCTVDQILAASLATRHVAFKHLGLASKIVVIDEVHSYDAYMSEFLCATLEALGAYGVPVILMSATLSSEARRRLMCSYARGITGIDCDIEDAYDSLSSAYDIAAYPRVSTFGADKSTLEYSFESCQVSQNTKDIVVRIVDAKFDLIEAVSQMVATDYHVGIICDTVRAAQEIYHMLREAGLSRLILSHSRFRACERLAKDAELLRLLGKESSEGGLVVVGTQTIEQSLDIDFDVLFTDIAPIDSILQRAGRLWRHSSRIRPQGCTNPVLYLMGADNWELASPLRFRRGIDLVYPKSLLWRTALALMENDWHLAIPADISPLTEKVFAMTGNVPESWCEAMDEADFEFQFGNKKDEAEASVATVNAVSNRSNVYTLSGWFSNVNSVDEYGDILTEAPIPSGVRKTDISATALIVQESNGHLLVPFKNDASMDLGAIGTEPDYRSLLRAAETTVSLPKGALSEGGLEYLLECQHRLGWDKISALRGFVPLIMDTNLSVTIPHTHGACELRYDFATGLSITN